MEEVTICNERSPLFDDNDLMLWKQSLSGNANFVLSKNKYPVLKGSFDMAWQQRSSGHNYNSPSGHGVVVGSATRKAIAMEIKSKRCNFCIQARKVLPVGPVGVHDCCQNWQGSSGAMEPQACLDMVVNLHNESKIVLGTICCDDDASTRSLLKWTNADYMTNYNKPTPPLVKITKGKNKGKLQVRPDKGQLPSHIPEPVFVADPNHRKKVLTGELIQLKNKKVADRLTMTRMDVHRIGKNFGYMIRALPQMDESQYENAGKAVLEHHFDNHEYCGLWCRRKTQTAQQRSEKKRYYRSKDDDKKLYEKLKETISRFVTLDRLRDVAHGLDTQVNESFNNTASWFAPKNKVYCGSRSLWNRLAMAVGINSVGFVVYFTRLYRKLGVAMEPSVLYFLRQKDEIRYKRLASIKLNEKKKIRMEKKFAQLKDDELIARKERAKRAGTYRPGMNMDDDTAEDFVLPKTKKNKSRKDLVCPHCGKHGHSTTRSKHCLQHPDNNPQEDQAQLKVENDADDLDAMDTMPLGDGDDGDSSSEDDDMFFDVGTWSEDEEDAAQGVTRGII